MFESGRLRYSLKRSSTRVHLPQKWIKDQPCKSKASNGSSSLCGRFTILRSVDCGHMVAGLEGPERLRGIASCAVPPRPAMPHKVSY